MAGYTSDVAKSHKKFTAALNRAKTRQACLNAYWKHKKDCLLYTSPSPRDVEESRMPSSA